MKRRIALVLTFLSICLSSLSGRAQGPRSERTYPPAQTLEEVREAVRSRTGDHPRLFVSGEGFESLRRTAAENSLGKKLAGFVLRQAELLQKTEPIERRLEGRRLLGQSRIALKRILTLAMAFRLSGERAHVRRCEEEMLAIAGFSDWNPSHFLDVAEMTLALAIGYDWLYDELSEASREKIRSAIKNKSLVLPFETEHNGWVRTRNNWGQVCHGGLSAGALAISEDEPELAARTIHSAIHNVTYSMEAYAPKGSYPEGPGYWAYGTSYNVLLIALLENALGTDFGLSRAPGFEQTGQYLALMTGPSGLFFNYADGGANRSPQAALFWFAHRYGRPDWLLGETARIEETIEEITPHEASGQSNRLLPLALVWMKDPGAADTAPREAAAEAVKIPLHWSGQGHVPVTVHRSSWTDPKRTFVGLKGGSPSANHGQMDIGSFVLDSDGVRWAVDLGAEGYHGIESRGMNLWNRSQDSDRWTIFRQMNQGHNTLVIDGLPQVASGQGEIVAFSDSAEFPHSLLDMSSVYAGQAESVLRGIGLVNSREVLIQDRLTGLKPGSVVRWGMITPGTPGGLGKSRVDLSQKDASLALTILSPGPARWEEIDISTPPREWDSPNSGLRMMVFEVTAPPSGEVSLAVLATPGSVSDSIASTLQLRPLAEWGK